MMFKRMTDAPFEIGESSNGLASQQLHSYSQVQVFVREDSIEKVSDDKTQDILIARIPVMVNSHLCQKGQTHKNSDCAFDDDGYFVINGAEMLKMAVNRAATRNDISTVQYALEVSADMFKTDANNVSDYVQRHLISQQLRKGEAPCWEVTPISKLSSLEYFLKRLERLTGTGRCQLKQLTKDLLKAQSAHTITREDVLGILGPSVSQPFNNHPPIDVINIYAKGDNYLLRWDSQRRFVDLTSKRIQSWDDIEIVGPVRDQDLHMLCGAFVSTDLTSAARAIEKVAFPYQMLSVREICFFACPEDRAEQELRGESHHCHSLRLADALKYMASYGAAEIEADEEVVFSCVNDRPTKTGGKIRIPGVHYIGDDINAIIDRLRIQPLGATVAIFEPEYSETKSGTYCGSTSNASCFNGFHALEVVDLRMNDEKMAFKCKSSHGEHAHDKGYIHVSATSMVSGCHYVHRNPYAQCGVYRAFEAAREGDAVQAPAGYDPIHLKDAIYLLSDFMCPKLASCDLANSRNDNDDLGGNKRKNKDQRNKRGKRKKGGGRWK